MDEFELVHDDVLLSVVREFPSSRGVDACGSSVDSSVDLRDNN